MTETKTKPKRTYTLRPSTGEPIPIGEDAVQMSGLLREMTMDDDDEEEEGTEIPIPCTRPDLLIRAVEFCVAHAHDPPLVLPDRINTEDDFLSSHESASWSRGAKFVMQFELAKDTFPMLLLADYLDIASLRTLLLVRLAHAIHRQTPDEVCALFGLGCTLRTLTEAQRDRVDDLVDELVSVVVPTTT